MTVDVVKVARAPAALRECADAPTVPGVDATGYDVGVFIRRLAEAHDDCKRTLAERNAWEDAAAERLEID